MASGLVCKGCSTSYLFAAGALPLYRSALFVAPRLFPISFHLITYTRIEDRVKIQTEHTEHVEGARKRDVSKARSGVGGWRGGSG